MKQIVCFISKSSGVETYHYRIIPTISDLNPLRMHLTATTMCAENRSYAAAAAGLLSFLNF